MKRPGRGERAAGRQPIAVDERVAVRGLAAGGRGVGTWGDGRTVFVPGGFPGDVVAVTRARVAKNFVDVTGMTVLEPSSARRPPECQDATRCGGCDLMGLELSEQRRQKRQIIEDSLVRLGNQPRSEVLGMLGFEAGRGLRYRQRIRLQVEGDRLGLFGAGSHRFVEVERCQVVTDELWRAVERLRHLLRGRGVTREVETVEVRLLPGGDCPSVDLVLSPGAATARVVSQWVELLASDFLVRARGSETLTLERYQLLPDTYLLAPVGGFVQVNHEMNTLLVQAVLSLAARRSLKSALDVFCGCGNFALPLARAGLEVTGVEAHGPAISAARLAAHEQGLVLQLHAQDAAAFLAEAVARGERHDLVVVDPPRAGAKGLTGYLGQICGQTLVMVSCDPATLARDVKELTSRGFRVASTTGFDMFPQTHHAETLCVLERVPSSS